ncbi:MAG: DUF4279 domain-containing protein [Planctomycetaceae bacterium]|nr:DUF4279 domain-containing protein [Planctomycetaceae bacterium]
MTSNPLVKVELRLTGEGFLPEDVTRVLQTAPTKTWRLGDPVQSTQLVRECDAWVLGFPQCEAYDIEPVLSRLLDAIEPISERMAKAVAQFNLKPEISFGVYIDGQSPAIQLSSDTIRRLAAIGVCVDVDLILLS